MAKNAGMAPQKRYGHSACLVKNKMYVFGGLDKSNFQTFYECTFKFGTPMDEGTTGLNGLLFSWDKIKADTPRARDSHSFIHVSIYAQQEVWEKYKFFTFITVRSFICI